MFSQAEKPARHSERASGWASECLRMWSTETHRILAEAFEIRIEHAVFHSMRSLCCLSIVCCVCVRVCWHWAPITRCTSHQRIVRIAWFPFPFSQLQLHCIGTLLTDTDPDVCAINFIFACCKSITTSRISSIVFDKTDEREAPTEFIGALCEINALDEELREWESEAKGRLVELSCSVNCVDFILRIFQHSITGNIFGQLKSYQFLGHFCVINLMLFVKHIIKVLQKKYGHFL